MSLICDVTNSNYRLMLLYNENTFIFVVVILDKSNANIKQQDLCEERKNRNFA